MSVFSDLFKGKFLSRLFSEKADAAPVSPSTIERVLSPRLKTHAISTAYLYEQLKMKAPVAGNDTFQSELAGYFSDCMERMRWSQKQLQVQYRPEHFSHFLVRLMDNLQRSVHGAHNGVILFDQSDLQSYADEASHILALLNGVSANAPISHSGNVISLKKQLPPAERLKNSHESFCTWIRLQPFFDHHRQRSPEHKVR